MVLDSQRARVGPSRVFTSRSRRRSRVSKRFLVAGIGLIVVIILIVMLTSNGPEQTVADSPNVPPPDAGYAGQVDPPALDPPTPSPAPRRPTVAPAPAPAPQPPLPKEDLTRPTPVAPAGTDAEVQRLIQEAREMIADEQFVRGRDRLNSALAGQISATDAAAVRRQMGKLNEDLIFSARVDPIDPFVEAHIISPNEYLSTIAAKYHVPWKFVKRINGNLNELRLRPGQRIKVVKGPFHVVVHKRAYRLDVYVQDMYVRSFRVGLGKDDSTPIGAWMVKPGAKQIDPPWTNPRTGKRYHSGDPKNPIGERWIGLIGTDDQTKDLTGYGIHGTIEPKSIGTQASMGCIRMMPKDVELLYDMLVEKKTTVIIRP